jgi:hypothetical protein
VDIEGRIFSILVRRLKVQKLNWSFRLTLGLTISLLHSGHIYRIITNDVSDYINLLVRIAHIICNYPICMPCYGA